ncbi:amino acid permease [Candidatus Uhrbacteria bacterium]|nr:amino acid permease [Candidatus Uhrbacteria bacterium]
MKQFLHAIATLSGLIIGVGIFGAPYVAAQAGFWIGLFWIVVVGVLVLTVHWFYGELIASTPGKHRLPGYVGYTFGKAGQRIVLITEVVRFWGLQLAYLIVGGMFLSLLLTPIFGGEAFTYSIILFIAVATVSFFGLRLVAGVEFYLAWLLIGALLFISGRGLAHFDAQNLFTAGGGGWFGPYGVLMVSLSGAAAIPELWDIVKRRKGVFRRSIAVGTLVPVVVTALFMLAVVGVSGSNTSEEAISGLQGVLGPGIMALGALTGFLAIITSYFVIALYLQEVLKYDFLVKHTPAWGFAAGIPLLLFLAGARSFIDVIDVVGSVLFGLEGMVIVAAALALMRRRHASGLNWKVAAGIAAAALMAVGAVQKLWQLL